MVRSTRKNTKTLCVCREEDKKGKDNLALNLEMKAKGNKKGFYRYINKRKSGENGSRDGSAAECGRRFDDQGHGKG